MQQEFSQFYRHFGVRKLDQLTAPPMTLLRSFDFPKLSLYHFVGPQDGVVVGPANDDFLLRKITRQIPMVNIEALRFKEGPFVAKPVQLSQVERAYLKKHRRFTFTKNIGTYETTPMTMPVINYGILPLTHHYRTGTLVKYQAWKNTFATIVATIADTAKVSMRHQFLVIDLPTLLPSVSQLNSAQTTMTANNMAHLHEVNNFFVLEMWKWLGTQEHREQSVFNQIPADQYDKLNFIFQESGRFTILNLGVLNQLRRIKGDANPPKLGYLTGALEPIRLQKRFLQFLMVIYQNRSVDNKQPKVVADETKNVEGESDQTDTTPQSKPQRIASTDLKGNDTSKITDPQEASLTTINSDHSDELQDKRVLSAEMDKEIDANMQALDDVARHVYALRRQNGVFDEDEHEYDDPDQESRARTLHAVGLASSVKIKETQPGKVVHPEDIPIHHNYSAGIQRHIAKLSSEGLMSPAEVRRFEKLGSAYHQIQAPNEQEPLSKFVVLDPKMVSIEAPPKIADRRTILDKSMLDNSLEVFDSQYIKHSLQRDIAAMVLNLQHAGYALIEYESNLEESLMGDRYSYRARYAPINGASSTIRFDIPDVNEDGVYVVNGTQYRLRKQTAPLPIRKVGQNEVILTSYYGKLFVRRDAKRVNDYGSWLSRAIMDKGFDQNNKVVTGFHPNNVFDPAYPAPRLYTILASNFSNFDLAPLQMPEELQGRILHFELDHRKYAELNGKYKDTFFQSRQADQQMIGYTNQGERIVIDTQNRLFVNARFSNGTMRQVQLPTFEAMIGLERLSAPVDFAVVKVMGRNIPIGVILAYYVGLETLFKHLEIEPRRVPARHRLNLTEHEYTIAFADETIILNRDNDYASLILAGFNEYHRALKDHSVHDFDKPAAYLNLLSSAGLSAVHLREIDLMRDLFLEPITREKLIEMQEPHEFIPLLERAIYLLTSDNHPRVTDGAYRHIKSYERLAGILYYELVSMVRNHRSKVGQSKQPLDLPPYKVWQAISEDTSKMLVKDINPVENLKQIEAVTASGSGGISGRMMARVNRISDENDKGVISESTVDSADTAVNTFTCASPLFNSVRGTANRYEPGKTGAASLFSTSALLSVAGDRDDGKRLNYASIQHGHGVPSKAYHAAALRTGYEQIVPYRTSDLFAYTARQDGVVESVNEHGIVLKYADGSKKSIETGRRFGLAEGAVIAHDVVPNVKQGQKVKRGDLISYHPNFFEPDPMNPGHVLWKSAKTITVALMENVITHEDACAISRQLSDEFETEVPVIRDIVLRFDQAISKLVKVGDKVDVEDVLCILEDPTSKSNRFYDETSLDTLRILQSHVPLAKTQGVVERIEFHYRGEREDMSESLRAFANSYDRQLAAKLKALGKTVHTAQTDTDYRLNGQALMPDTAVIQITITKALGSGVGDKWVMGNQMKSIISEVVETPMKTESGIPIDMIFGYKSVADRIVRNVEVQGTTTVCLELAQQRMLAAYRKK